MGYSLLDLFAMWSGDDSVILLPNDVNAKVLTNILARVFNLEAKVFNYSTMYFCSKFMFHDDNTWFIVPDVWKLIIKLGRNDLVDCTHIEQYRISLVDLTKPMGNVLAYPFLNLAMRDRYGLDIDCDLLYAAIYYFVRDSKQFTKSFYIDDCDEILNYSGGRPSLDI